jgi:hypothetical protein
MFCSAIAHRKIIVDEIQARIKSGLSPDAAVKEVEGSTPCIDCPSRSPTRVGAVRYLGVCFFKGPFVGYIFIFKALRLLVYFSGRCACLLPTVCLFYFNFYIPASQEGLSYCQWN